MTFLISYELNTPQKDYSSFFAALRECGESIQVSRNTIALLVRNDRQIQSVDSLANFLAKWLSPSDRLLIYDITGRRGNGLQTDDTWKWLNARING